MREDKRYELEVHVAGICLRKSGKSFDVLVAKRAAGKSLFPGLWECGGGQVHPGENFEEAVKRQLAEELGVIIDINEVIGTYEIQTPGHIQKKIPGIKFVCTVRGYLNGEGPKTNPRDFSEWRWQPVSKIGELQFIKGIPADIMRAVQTLSK